MKKITKKSIKKWLQREKWTLHEAVCIALDYEPEGERPENPSEEYLLAEKWIIEHVPPAGAPRIH